MFRRIIGLLAAGASVLWATAPLPAQSQFEVVAQQTVAEVSGLRIVTIRDRQSSECHTLFIVESTVPEPQCLPRTPQTRRLRRPSNGYKRRRRSATDSWQNCRPPGH
jgi:hypothetical protein